MAEESDTGPTRHRRGSQREDAHTIERESRDPASASATASERGGAAKDAPVREDEPVAAPLPQRVTRKYYVTQASHNADERRVYADERGEYLVFKDQGDRLTTRRHEAAIVRDLVAVAVHRDWSALRVSGSDAFRREVWLEASARGIDVSGYTPSQLDRAALARRADERERRGKRTEPGQSPARASQSVSNAMPILDRTTSDKGQRLKVTADYGREDVASSAANRSQNDASLLHARLATGSHDRFRVLPLGKAIEDADLSAAHSQIAVLDRALRLAFPNNATVRETVLRAARERVAYHIDEGRTLQRAAYRMPGHEHAVQHARPQGRDSDKLNEKRYHHYRDQVR